MKHDVILALLAALEYGFWLLPLGLARSLGASLGRLFCAIVPYERKKTLLSLERAFPELIEPARRRLASDVFASLGQGGAEFLRYKFVTPATVDSWISEVIGEEHFLGPIRQGRGVVAVTGHYGNWELLASWTAQRGKVAGVGRQVYDSRLDEALTWRRNQKNITMFQRNTPVRPILRWLKDGCVLGVLADQDTGVNSLYVDFFGREAKTPSGPAVLAQATGAVLVSGYCRRKKDGSYCLTIEKEIPVPERGVNEGPMDLWPVVQEYARRMEVAIREEPGQWAFNHDRWRSKISEASTGWDPALAGACLERIAAWRLAGRPPFV